ncbi:hypothetical protein [Mucilaginibacter sp. HD30]
MELNENLGTLVLVNPEIENDPAGRKGDIGIVAYIDAPKGEIYLRFPDEFEAVYPLNAVFALKERKDLFNGGAHTAPDLKSYKDLFKISTLREMGRSTDLWKALEIARDNPRIWPNSLFSLTEGQNRRQVPNISR